MIKLFDLTRDFKQIIQTKTVEYNRNNSTKAVHIVLRGGKLRRHNPVDPDLREYHFMHVGRTRRTYDWFSSDHSRDYSRYTHITLRGHQGIRVRSPTNNPQYTPPRSTLHYCLPFHLKKSLFCKVFNQKAHAILVLLYRGKWGSFLRQVY